MQKKNLSHSEQKENLLIGILPSVLSYYNQKKADWTKSGLSVHQQLKTTRQINDVMALIRRATLLGRYHESVYTDLENVLERYARYNSLSSMEKICVFGGAEHLLRQGDDALKKIAWWYGAYPEVYKEKFALNKSGIKFDKLAQLFQKQPYPYYSFISFAKGENPAFSCHPQIWEKVMVTQDFKKNDNIEGYQSWLNHSAKGKKYIHDKIFYTQILGDILLQAHACQSVEERALKFKKHTR